ncbi:MAG TPA: 23S rRNA (uracil(1939)-C(5))-methyltransferase RlmD [Edaphobacter sp.]|jgi:23S rRNA (uracil1939-C5)-methyltransferase|nr:23S rRNA (uracil(1939)-C(5))-methyltransferase RlmD [Edaphobacter sp.]
MKLHIEKAVYGGNGLAHQTQGVGAGKAVFVPFTLPGELVEARLLKHDATFEEASLVQVLSPSQDRVTPRCSHFGQCGGCHYQHATYAAQVQMKIEVLRETLGRATLTSLPPIQLHSGEPWHYRNRTRLRLSESEGALRLGYNRRGSNEFLAIHECPILAPILWHSVESVLQIVNEYSALTRWVRNVTEVEFFTNNDEKKLQIEFFFKKQQSGLTAFCEQLQKQVPELTGASAFLLSSTGLQRRAKSARYLETWGAPGLIYRAADDDYWVKHGGFFQINRYLVDELVEIVTARKSGVIAWDLYAGVGLFSKALAKSFGQVVAVEAAENDLSRSFTGPGRRAVKSTTVDFLRNALVQRDRPQLIVMDPPRAGLGTEVCTHLARIAAPELVYVSCDPVTLARDLKTLISTGYKIEDLHMVDMFPQTFHLETIAVLRK